MSEAEHGGMSPQAKECPRPPEAGRDMEVSSFRGLGKNMTLPTPCVQTSNL